VAQGDADAAAEALAGLHDAMGSMPIQHPVQAAAAAIFSASIAPLPACGSQDDQGVVFLGVSGGKLFHLLCAFDSHLGGSCHG